jgi:amidophosphoribosyltransferase
LVSREDCVLDLFYGTDFHSHLGTRRGGLAVRNSRDFSRFIHNIENAQFRSKFDDDITRMQGHMGIGCISDTEDQPLIIGSHLGSYAIVTVGRINNLTEIVERAFEKRTTHFAETTGDGFNPTEVIASVTLKS